MAHLEKIRDFAEIRNISLVKLAAAVGFKDDKKAGGIHSMIAKGSTTTERLEKIANVLNVPVSAFFDDEPATTIINKGNAIVNGKGAASIYGNIVQNTNENTDIESLKKIIENQCETIRVLQNTINQLISKDERDNR